MYPEELRAWTQMYESVAPDINWNKSVQCPFRRAGHCSKNPQRASEWACWCHCTERNCFLLVSVCLCFAFPPFVDIVEMADSKKQNSHHDGWVLPLLRALSRRHPSPGPEPQPGHQDKMLAVHISASEVAICTRRAASHSHYMLMSVLTFGVGAEGGGVITSYKGTAVWVCGDISSCGNDDQNMLLFTESWTISRRSLWWL